MFWSTPWVHLQLQRLPQSLPQKLKDALELLAILVAVGLQAMKKADAEEPPAMKSMKAMKAG